MVEILIADKNYDTINHDQDYSLEIKQALEQLGEVAEIHRSDIGHGADFPVFVVQLFKDVDLADLALTTVLAGYAVFLSGERIEKSWDAWTKLKERFSKLRTKLNPTRIDEYAAVLMALERVEHKPALDSFNVTVQVLPGQPGPSGISRTDKLPDAIYIVTLEIGGRTSIFGVKSTGEFVFDYHFNSCHYEF